MRIGTDLATRMPRPRAVSTARVERRMQDALMSDPALRAALFRFVDVRPACATPRTSTRHLHELLAEAARLAPARPRRRASPAGLATRARSPRSPPPASSRWPSASSSAPTPSDALPADHEAVARRRRRRPSTCSARRRSPRRRPTATPQRCEDAAARRSRGAAALEPTRRRSRASTCRVKVSALTPLLRPQAPERGIDGAAAAAAPPAAGRPRHRRAPARRHGVLRHARGDHRAHARPARPSPSSRTARRAGIVLQAYLIESPRAPRAPARLGARARRARTRSRSGWSRAPTGTTRSSRPPSTAGSRRSSPTAARATATSRRSPAA